MVGCDLKHDKNELVISPKAYSMVILANGKIKVAGHYFRSYPTLSRVSNNFNHKFVSTTRISINKLVVKQTFRAFSSTASSIY